MANPLVIGLKPKSFLVIFAQSANDSCQTYRDAGPNFYLVAYLDLGSKYRLKQVHKKSHFNQAVDVQLYMGD